MELTSEQIEEIVTKVIERTLLRMPETIGNLMAHHASIRKMKKEFFDSHEQFKKYPLIVSSVIEEIEAKSNVLDYNELLKLAVPKIEERIRTIEQFDVERLKEKKDLLTTLNEEDSFGVL